MVYAVRNDLPLVTKKTVKKTRKLNDHEKNMRKAFSSYDKFVIDADSSGKVFVKGLKNE